MVSVKVCGKRFNSGSVTVGGYKHSLVPIVAASALSSSPIKLRNIPEIEEAYVLAAILNECGASVQFSQNDMTIAVEDLKQWDIPSELSWKIHGSLYLIPTYLGRLGKVRFADSGGCQIGEPGKSGKRPIQHMLSVMERFGATFEWHDGLLWGETSKLHACEIDIMDYSDRHDLLTGPLVSGATKTAILAAVACEDRSIIYNPYPKPDVTELVSFLRKCGHKIDKDSKTISITPSLTEKSLDCITYDLMSDISEVMTYITISVYLGQSLQIAPISVPEVKAGLQEELRLLQLMGIDLNWGVNSLEINPPRHINSIDIEVTSIGIYSDHQPFFALMLLRGDKPSYIREHVWKHRFDYALELKKLGADMHIKDDTLYIVPSHLQGENIHLYGRDLRAAAVLLISALSVENTIYVHGIEHLSRGYANLIQTLETLGTKIELQG